MASLKEIRTRIASVNSTKQVTSAMKLVSAAKLRKAQDAILKIRPYAEKLHHLLTLIGQNIDAAQDNPYAEQREPNKVLLVVVTSNKGLCGAFNSNAVKKAITLATETYSQQYQQGNLDFFAVGRKGAELLKARGYAPAQRETEIFDNLSFDNAAGFAEDLMKKFKKKTYDRIEIVYNQFKNAATQILQAERFLPIEMPQDHDEEQSRYYNNYIFEPSQARIADVLIPKTLKIQFLKALLDSNASEHGARMTAMHKATDNATEIIKELKINYNKARQAAITNELIEIVSGADALDN